MKVELWLKETSQPLKFDGVTNTYEKGSFYCIYFEGDAVVFKYPLPDIFRTIESYDKPKKSEELKS